MPMSTNQISPRCALVTGLLLRFELVQGDETVSGHVVTEGDILGL